MHRKGILYFAAALITLVESASGQPAEKDQPKPARLVTNALVQVVADPASGLADRDLLVVLGSNEALLAKAIAKVSPEAAKRAGAIDEVGLEIGGDYHREEAARNTPGVARVLVTLGSLEGVPADKLLTAWMECLQEKLRDIDVGHQADEERDAVLAEQVQVAGRNLEKQMRAYDELAKLHKMPKNAEIAAQMVAQLELQRQTMVIDLQGLNARQERLQEQLAIMGARVKEEAAKDPVVVELAKALEIQKRLAALRQAAGGRKREPVEAIQELEAQAELAKHQAELSKFRREAVQSAGGGRLTDLKRRLEDTAIEIAESKAKLEAVSALEGGVGFSAQVEQKRLEIENLEREYRVVAEEMSAARRKLRIYQPPQVKLMDSSTVKTAVTLPEAPGKPTAPQPAKDAPSKPAKPPEKPASPAK